VKIDKIEQLVKDLQGAMEDQQTAQSATRGMSAAEVTARAQAKAFTVRLRKVAPIVIRENPDAQITLDQLNPGETIGDSTPRLIGYLVRLRPYLVPLDSAFARYFKNRESPVEILDRVHANLAAVDSVQEVAVQDLPAGTRAVYASKGRLLELIEDCNQVGWVAFEEEPEIRALFNKDILLRARKSRVAKPEPEPEPPK